jgi:hypothetical protein
MLENKPGRARFDWLYKGVIPDTMVVPPPSARYARTAAAAAAFVKTGALEAWARAGSRLSAPASPDLITAVYIVRAPRKTWHGATRSRQALRRSRSVSVTL